MKTRQSNDIQCEIYHNPSRAWLSKAWRELEHRSRPNFFLSWLWIVTWLDCFVKEFALIEATKNGKIMGLGILVKQTEKLSLIPLKSKYHLHRTGNPNQDQIWIEYNDFLIDASEEQITRNLMIERLSYWINSRDAIVIGASEPHKFEHIESLGLHKRTVWETDNYAIDLDRLRLSEQTVLQFLSRNSRYQILRSMRKYDALGDILLEKATNITQAKAMLALAKPLHSARWNKDKPRSGFTNPQFVAFHERLIEKGIKMGVIELYHVKVGSETLSVIYNFKHDNRVYFYLCAINYERKNSQYKPGLVSHYLLINKALQEGARSYDFMGGSARYKQTFSNIRGRLTVNQFEHPSLLLKLEHSVRHARQWWKKRNIDVVEIGQGGQP